MKTYSLTYLPLAEALYAALSVDPFYHTMEQSLAEESSKEAMLCYLDYSMVESKRFGDLFIPENEAYGVSVWSKPLNPDSRLEKSKQKKQFLWEQMGENSLKIYSQIVEFMSEKAQPLIPEKSWYLSILGVMPRFQGQGLGASLVSPILHKTDALGIPTYLETFTPRNMTFYQRLGYQAIASFEEPTTHAPYWIMMREPVSLK